MVQQQSDNYAENGGLILQYYRKQIRKSQKLGSGHCFMSHIKQKLTFFIMGHYGCQSGILATKNLKHISCDFF